MFTPDEHDRFVGDRTWEEIGPDVAWEILYRKEPELYERLIRGEHIHPDVIGWLPRVRCAVEIAAGTGRLTRDLVARCDQVIAVEPAATLRETLRVELDIEVLSGFFNEIPVGDDIAQLAVSCSAFTSDLAHGGDVGLHEMERVVDPGGLVVLVWPSDVDWLRDRGFTHESFGGEMDVDFGTLEEAVELAAIFYPDAVAEIESRGSARVTYEVLGMNAPRDLAWKRVT